MNVKNMTDKISVYGATGFIGGTFCRMYSDEVIAIEKKDRQPKSKNILYFISTTTNYNFYSDLFVDINTNLKILMEVLQHCKDQDITFNFISSGFVYGPDILDAKETDNCNPRGAYSITKRTAEQLLIEFCEHYDVKYRILRIASVYGTDKTISSKKNVLGYMINLLKENKDITLYDGGEFIKDYMHVDDICRALKIVLDKGENNQIYNIASGSSINFKELIETAKELTKSRSEIISIPGPEKYKSIQGKNFTLNTDKLKSLRFKPEIELHEGLQSLCF
jgi:nucleoside-diphosphate-sugar epimerase